MAIIPNNSVKPNSHFNGQKKLALLLGGLALLLVIAVAVVATLYFTRTQVTEPTTENPQLSPTSVEATAVSLVVEATSTQAPQMVLIVTSPTPTITPTPIDSPAVVESSDVVELERAATATRAPTSTPTPTPRPFRPTATPTPAGGNIDGWIELISPAENFYLPADGLIFQWKWHENKGCQQPLDGYGFEVRVWRDVSTDFPQGAMNAKEEKVNITCDPKDGVYTFSIGNIKKVPGVHNAKDGRFKWDIAIVQLDPYTPIITSQSRIFYY